jgi:hypothetical protein
MAREHKLTEQDVFTLWGHAVIEYRNGKQDMPIYFADLARRIADEIERPDLAARLRESSLATEAHAS